MKFLKEAVLSFEDIKQDVIDTVDWFLENGYRLNSSITRALDHQFYVEAKQLIIVQHYFNSPDLSDEILDEAYNLFYDEVHNTYKYKR